MKSASVCLLACLLGVLLQSAQQPPQPLPSLTPEQRLKETLAPPAGWLHQPTAPTAAMRYKHPQLKAWMELFQIPLFYQSSEPTMTWEEAWPDLKNHFAAETQAFQAAGLQHLKGKWLAGVRPDGLLQINLYTSDNPLYGYVIRYTFVKSALSRMLPLITAHSEKLAQPVWQSRWREARFLDFVVGKTTQEESLRLMQAAPAQFRQLRQSSGVVSAELHWLGKKQPLLLYFYQQQLAEINLVLTHNPVISGQTPQGQQLSTYFFPHYGPYQRLGEHGRTHCLAWGMPEMVLDQPLGKDILRPSPLFCSGLAPIVYGSTLDVNPYSAQIKQGLSENMTFLVFRSPQLSRLLRQQKVF